MPARPIAPTLLGLSWPLVIGWLTLRPAPEAADLVALTPWWCIACGEAGSADLLQNLLLFVPLGLAWRGWRWGLGRVVGVGLAATLGIELTQAFLLTGRDAALGDVLANTAGAVVGWWLAPALGRLAAGDAAVARRAAAGLLGLFAGQLVITAWLLQPVTPPADDRQPVPPPLDAQQPWYGGEVLEAVLAPSTPQGGVAAVSVRVVWVAPATEDWMPVVAFGRSLHDVIAGVAVQGDRQVSAGYRTRAVPYGWRSPVVTAPLPSLEAGDTVSVVLREGERALALSVTGGGSDTGTTARVAMGAQHGWVLINPFTQRVGIPGAWAGWTLAWLLGWGVLLGWCAGASGHPLRWGLGLAGLAGGLPLLLGTPLRPVEALALAAGWLLAGWGARRATGSRRTRRDPVDAVHPTVG